MSTGRAAAQGKRREAEGAWFWRRLDQASTEFDSLPGWMKRKDFKAAAPAREPRKKAPKTRRLAA
jgi:hypothetical protein